MGRIVGGVIPWFIRGDLEKVAVLYRTSHRRLLFYGIVWWWIGIGCVVGRKRRR